MSADPITDMESLLLTPDERRTVSVDDHHHFQKSISTDATGRDLIDQMKDDDLYDMIEVDPYNREPSSRKSDASLGRLLAILDSLPTGKDADEG